VVALAGGARVVVPDAAARPGEEIRFAVRADRMTVAAAARLNAVGSGDAVLADGSSGAIFASVASVEYQGAWIKLGLASPDAEEVCVLVSEAEFDARPVAPGDRVEARWRAASAHVLGG
jgi:putative spermidine/putrescine transport system ATP-binding protein